MEAFFWYFPVSALINAAASFALGFFVLVKNYRIRLVQYLFYFCTTVGLWSVAYFFWQISSTEASALYWSRMLMYGAIFTSLSYFHLVLVFLQKEKQNFYRFVLAIFYTMGFVWVGANTTHLFVAGVEPRLFFAFWPIPGPLYAPFLIMFIFQVLFASALLFVKYLKSHGIERRQTLLLLIGIFLAFVGGCTNYPLWYNIPIAPWGNVLVSIYIILTVYSIMKYGFLDLRVVAAEIFTGILMVIFFIDAILARNNSELAFRLLGLLIMSAFGAMLIRSVRREVARREELSNLARSLEKANLRLQELDQQKNEFLSIASHQLRTPLSIIKGYIELIEDGAYGKPTKKTVEILDHMDKSNEQLIKLVDEFLDITRIEQGRTKFLFESADITQILKNTVKEFEPRADAKGLSLKYKGTKIPIFSFDKDKIQNVIFNFLDNAIKYSDSGEILLGVEQKDNGIKVWVRDQGIGFAKEDEASIFQKFYRGKNVEGKNVNGTGLGIYVCRKFIEGHNGYVWGKSRGLKKGSEFGFWIPFK